MSAPLPADPPPTVTALAATVPVASALAGAGVASALTAVAAADAARAAEPSPHVTLFVEHLERILRTRMTVHERETLELVLRGAIDERIAAAHPR